jgi:ribosomal protein L11 methyltransferase
MTYSKKKAKQWREINLYNVSDKTGLLTQFLFEKGCLGITEGEEKLILYFDADSAIELLKEIENFLDDNNFKNYRLVDTTIKDEDWHLSWQKYFTPQKITDRITVYPEWETIDESIEIPIRIRPGMAFGTGTHETTQLALTILENKVQKGMKILDAGCGAGILTIAALKLGAKSVDSVEIDGEAKDNFNENLELNNCTGKMLIKDVTKLEDYDYDLVVSNIQFNPNVALLETLVEYNFTNPVIFTGILTEEREQFIDKVKQFNRTVTAQLIKNEWVAFIVKPEVC